MTSVNDPVLPGLHWRKSSRSGDTGGNCVEIAFPEGAVAARDSKDPSGGMLVFGHSTWASFLHATNRGTFDRG